MKKHEKYIETTEFPGNTHLQISVYYSLGGANYLSGGTNARGFYLSVTPVNKGNGCVSYTLFSGLKMFILPANRYSEKQFNLAIEKSAEHEQELIDAVKEQQKKSA